jgi:NAD(P)-dependent dehydrogenase (short-subunit alcohol dehydrogenase family)
MNYNNIFVFSANGTIGIELLKELKIRNPQSKIYASYNSNNNMSVLNEITQGVIKVDAKIQKDWDNLGVYLKQLNIKFDYVISAIGTLSANHKGPEKSLRDINLGQLHDVFEINSFHSVMLAKQFRNFLSRDEKTKLIFLSAMVGSIEENDMGGWYSYRASKTALNMFVKNISIEYTRMGLPLKVYSVHPGTTDTKLSNKYLGGIKHTVWSAKDSASHILNVVDSVEYETGSFFNWDGRRIEW